MKIDKLVCSTIIGVFIAIALSGCVSPKTEDELVAELASPKQHTVINALDELEKEYPNSPNSLPMIKKLLADERADVRERAVRWIGRIHTRLNDDDFKNISKMLESSDRDELVATLRALRALDAQSIVPGIIPLLKNSDSKIKREACRTLAILGDKSVVTEIEPLLTDPDSDVQKTAKDAIFALNNKTP